MDDNNSDVSRNKLQQISNHDWPEAKDKRSFVSMPAWWGVLWAVHDEQDGRRVPEGIRRPSCFGLDILMNRGW